MPIYLVTIWVIPVIIAITFHEAAHGFVAHLLGDDTAWRLGRVSFNMPSGIAIPSGRSCCRASCCWRVPAPPIDAIGAALQRFC
jgi:hypothetical protein